MTTLPRLPWRVIFSVPLLPKAALPPSYICLTFLGGDPRLATIY